MIDFGFQKLINIKYFSSPTCGQKFAQRYNMNSHMKVHQGITRTNKMQKCSICNKTFARKAKLEQHMGEFHPKQIKAPQKVSLLRSKIKRHYYQLRTN